VRLMPGGTLLYLRDNALWAVPFDSARLHATGTAVRLVDSVRVEVGGAMQVAAADDGTIVYLAGGSTATRVVSFDRSGRSASLAMPRRVYSEPRVSPDGRSLALSMRDQDNDIWIWSFDRRTLTRLTLDSAIETSPAWTPDGNRIIFASKRGNRLPNPYWQTADGTGQPEQLIESVYPTDQFSMAPDGRRLLMRVRLEQTSAGIAMVDLGEKPRRLQILIDTRFNERSPAVSPDGRWVAYESDESGRREVYVKPFPEGTRGRWQVSTAGGISPRWSSGGRQLTFVSGDGTWHTVTVIDGAGFQFGTATRISPADTALTLSYDIFPDGKTFVAVQGDVAPASKRLTVVLNSLTGVAR
jgi:eukaryotic-like serine/threonine-protein kinase